MSKWRRTKPLLRSRSVAGAPESRRLRLRFSSGQQEALERGGRRGRGRGGRVRGARRCHMRGAVRGAARGER